MRLNGYGSRWQEALVGLSALAIALGCAAPARAAAPMDSFLLAASRGGGRPSIVRVIARINGDLTQAEAKQVRLAGGSIYCRLPLVSSVGVRLPISRLSRLASLPFVQRLSADERVRKCDEFTVGHSGADVAYSSGWTGKGITVAVIDSGINSTQDLGGTRILAAVSFVPPPAGQQPTAVDQCGHGTHVAGIIAGNGAMSTGKYCFQTFYGIARRSNVVNVRVLDQNGEGTVSQVIQGIQWVLSNQSRYNIRVINLSAGHPVGESYSGDPLCQAVEQAWQAGIVVVCAAGNDGRLSNTPVAGQSNEGYGTNYGSIQCPGNDPYVITVGATKEEDSLKTDDRIATYSSRGPTRLDFILKPDIVAPGNRVVSLYAASSTLATLYGSTNAVAGSAYSTSPLASSKAYFVFSGTSMAAPVVSGAAALMLQANPSLKPDAVKARLMFSADKWAQPDGTTDPCTFGAGYLDIPAAMASTITPTVPAMSPDLVEDSNGDVFVNQDNAIWGNNAIWGTGVTDFRAVWGDNAIWGVSTNLLSSSNAIWGLGVWTDNAIWGFTTGQADLSSTAVHGE